MLGYHGAPIPPTMPMPNTSDLLRSALTRHQRGDLAAAADEYAAVLAREPDHIEALNMLGVLRHQQGDRAEALRLLDRAAALAPGHAGILSNRAAVHLAKGDAGAARHDAEAAVRADPALAGAWLNLGIALDACKRTAEAAGAFARAAALRPQDARMLLLWFSAAARSQQGAGLAERSRRAPPALARERELALATADELAQYGYSNQALYLLAQLRSELPTDAHVARRLAVEAGYRQALELEQRPDAAAALAAADAVLAAAPRHRGARMLRAGILGARGEASRATAEYRRLVEEFPHDAVAGEALLIALQYDPDVTADALAQAHFDWAARHMPSVAPRWRPQAPHADPERRLRIGWLSPRFFAGLAETFFLPALERFDRERTWHMLYESGGVADAATERFRRAADAYADVSVLDDAALAERIRADCIDVLVELSGHGPGNRLRALAARPAPVQASWFDYFHSTGTAAVDVLLSDAVLSPAETQVRYSERVSILPSGRLCYAPPAELPGIALRVAGAALRFACFNRVDKINDAVLAAWAEILARVPKATLKLMARAFDDAGERTYFFDRAGRSGIAAERIELAGYGTPRDALSAYGEVDIALDTFPFSGCATSCDALSMGVPVVALRGETMAGRQSASLLTSLGLSELVCADARAYVETAVALAENTARRAALRQELRG
ncbi:MAG TPA: tetratricopeptide repeat protein, partial [Rudaea sp.]|nr:tetratricopeptide repeat protein [Rudaea sp.]